MVSVNTRELTHNFARYLKKVQGGQKVVVMLRNKPVATLVPVEGAMLPPWKTVAPSVKLGKGASISDLIVKYRDEERA
ncbi:MAG: hypothetical protein HGA80_07465 [Candidatus Omnitrophica bacterium]|nr:hypothetical protein [Candidatus Omnitrophota bacterium]